MKVHLETNPLQFEMDESKYKILMQNEQVRMEILAHLLNKHLDISVRQFNTIGDKCTYQEAYFLGKHEVSMLKKNHLCICILECPLSH